MTAIEGAIISYAVLLAMASSEDFSELAVTIAWAVAAGYLIYLAKNHFGAPSQQAPTMTPGNTPPPISPTGGNS